MMSVRAIRRSAACAVLCAVLTSCETLDYGDKALEFVNGPAASLSRRLAAADLRSRWFNAHQVAVAELVSAAALLSERLTRIAADAGISSESDEAALVATESKLAQLNAWLYDMEVLENHTRHISDMCSSKVYFTESGIGSLGLISPLASVQDVEPQLNFEFTRSFATDKTSDSQKQENDWVTDGINTFVQIVENWLNAAQVEEQNNKLHQAKDKYLTIAIRGDELFRLSEQICKAQMVLEAERYAAEAETVRALRADFSVVKTGLNAQREVLEIRIIRARIKKREETSGVLADLRRQSHDIAIGNLGWDLVGLNAQLDELSRRAGGACNNLAGLRAWEDLSDALGEASVELAAVSGMEDLPADLRKALDEATKKVAASLAELPGEYYQSRRRPCP